MTVQMRGLLAMLCVATPLTAGAADTVSGTFTVKGRTLKLSQVSVVRTSNPAEPDSSYLVLLMSDVPVPAADRRPSRLADLARAGKVHAVRVTWKSGFDDVTATPFHGSLDDNGQPTRGGVILDLQGLDEKRLKAHVHSKALGQDWHFNARLDAAIVPVVSSADDFRDPVPVVAPTGVERSTAVEKSGPGTPTELKRALGRHGYEYTGEAFSHAVKDGNLEAVELFLQLGMSADTKDSIGSPVLMSAAMMCTRPPEGSRAGIVKALLAAKASVDPKDENGSTPLLWSVNAQCPIEIPRALVAAGANVNAKAKGGATPLMLAKVFQRADLIELLEKAGAR
jgi:hypothetical protein